MKIKPETKEKKQVSFLSAEKGGSTNNRSRKRPGGRSRKDMFLTARKPTPCT
jgi:hypothetical protein